MLPHDIGQGATADPTTFTAHGEGKVSLADPPAAAEWPGGAYTSSEHGVSHAQVTAWSVVWVKRVVFFLVAYRPPSAFLKVHFQHAEMLSGAHALTHVSNSQEEERALCEETSTLKELFNSC